MATAENARRKAEETPSGKSVRGVPPAANSGKRPENPQRSRPSRFFGVLDYFVHREEEKNADNLEHYLELSGQNPENAALHLKVAEIYQRRGKEKEAIGQYLQASDIFIREHSIPEAMAIYKQVLSLNPHLVEMNLKMGEIYTKMGMLEEAISQYRTVGKYYARWGRKEKIPEVAKILRDLESRRRSREKGPEPRSDSLKIPEARPETLSLSASRMAVLTKREMPGTRSEQKKESNESERFFDLGAELASAVPVDWKGVKEVSTERFSGFDEFVNELRQADIPRDAYPDFHYHLGVACREMGFNDWAIEQFQIAFQNNQNPLESARLLSRCFREKGWFHEAQKYFEKALEIETHAHKGTLGFKSDLVMVHG